LGWEPSGGKQRETEAVNPRQQTQQSNRSAIVRTSAGLRTFREKNEVALRCSQQLFFREESGCGEKHQKCVFENCQVGNGNLHHKLIRDGV